MHIGIHCLEAGLNLDTSSQATLGASRMRSLRRISRSFLSGMGMANRVVPQDPANVRYRHCWANIIVGMAFVSECCSISSTMISAIISKWFKMIVYTWSNESNGMISQHPPDKLAISGVGVGTWFLLDLGVAEPPSKAHRQRTWQQVFWPQILSRITGMKWAVWQVRCFHSTCMQPWFKRTAQSIT